ncbi:PA0069 family radical SAM protein [Sulfitobacter aestuariivivens]|uniref:PA0069 family radical SAM protein n=1 Tax=Sulfitobacter aestuariivivens TaxID=2766981 RepID=A0A927D1I0_9RHOB|nr:PA0069 family radical SAM protein [Sulfitobacter aestuariivivens]MBD3663363.1 PA0069 family radical SAM protein [Sulfitobacter aestuariivivens]
MDDERRRYQIKGRAAGSNHAGRFERHTRTLIDDGWAVEEELPVLRTQISVERPRSLITYNRSPDLPFDRSINPYRGCEHGCVYCFARPTHAYLGLSPGLDFETRLVARPEAPAVLRRELAARKYKVAPIAIGTNTDPYQPIERDQGIMRACLQVLSDAGHPVAIVTKGSLIERDLDILGDMARRGLVRVGVSVTTLDAKLSRLMEPRAPAPERRLQMIRRLSAAGVPVRIMASPMIPALTDPELEAILAAGRNAGARTASWIMLRLPREVSPLVQEWLAAHYPDRAGRIMSRLREMHGGKEYDARWHARMRGEGPYAEMVAQRFDVSAKRLGLRKSAPPMRCDLFRAPVLEGAQMSLFG